MKNLDLFKFGVEEMDEVQMQEVDGGNFAIAVGACVLLAGICYYAYKSKDIYVD